MRKNINKFLSFSTPKKVVKKIVDLPRTLKKTFHIKKKEAINVKDNVVDTVVDKSSTVMDNTASILSKIDKKIESHHTEKSLRFRKLRVLLYKVKNITKKIVSTIFIGIFTFVFAFVIGLKKVLYKTKRRGIVSSIVIVVLIVGLGAGIITYKNTYRSLISINGVYVGTDSPFSTKNSLTKKFINAAKKQIKKDIAAEIKNNEKEAKEEIDSINKEIRRLAGLKRANSVLIKKYKPKMKSKSVKRKVASLRAKNSEYSENISDLQDRIRGANEKIKELSPNLLDIKISSNVEVSNKTVMTAKEIEEKFGEEMLEVTGKTAKLNVLKANGVKFKSAIITVDGEPVVNLATQDDAINTLNFLRNNFVAKGEEITSYFTQNVAITEGVSTYADILNVDKAVNKLMYGKTEVKRILIRKKTSLSDLAGKLGVSLENIRKANNFSTKVKTVAKGKRINYSTNTSYVTLVSSGISSSIKTIPYKTVKQKTSKLYDDESEVAKYGILGKNKVREVLTTVNGKVISSKPISTVVLRKPKAKVIKVGTKERDPYNATEYISGNGSFLYPAPGTYFGGGYGVYRGGGWYHRGVDLIGPYGTPIYAAKAGTVVSSGWDGSYGIQVAISHSDGFLTRYAHMCQNVVSSGQYVKKGQLIGYVGQTGRAYGTHLHFEMTINGSFVNPMYYLP